MFNFGKLYLEDEKSCNNLKDVLNEKSPALAGDFSA